MNVNHVIGTWTKLLLDLDELLIIIKCYELKNHHWHFTIKFSDLKLHGAICQFLKEGSVGGTT